MDGFVGALLGLFLGMALMVWIFGAAELCLPHEDAETGIITAAWRGKNYEMVRLLGTEEAVKDD